MSKKRATFKKKGTFCNDEDLTEKKFDPFYYYKESFTLSNSIFLIISMIKKLSAKN